MASADPEAAEMRRILGGPVMLVINSPYISEQFSNGTLIAGIGLIIVGTYYVRVSREARS